jgi:hypothetical protein
MADPAAPAVTVGINAVIVAVTREVPRILTVPWRRDDPAIEDDIPPAVLECGGPTDSLPYGPLDPARDSKLERALRRWVYGQTGISLGYAEQLYTFGDQHRDPRCLHGGPRSVSVAYLALVHEESASEELQARWRDVYNLFPWEDWREGRPAIIDEAIAPALASWAELAQDRQVARLRRERAEIAFGLGEAGWDGDRVLERFELLYELGLVAERWWDCAYRSAATTVEAAAIEPPVFEAAHAEGAESATICLGSAMAIDHRRIVATALGRLRGKIKYRPVVFELLPPEFTLLQLQRIVEALAGVRLHKGNFRRLVERGGLVEGTGRLDTQTGGRPAELFRFRRDVLRERKTPGVGLPKI